MQNINLLRKDLSQIKEFGIVSIFWITDTNARARRVAWLENHGFIVRNRNDKRDAFPYCVFDVTAKRLTQRALDGAKSAPKNRSISGKRSTASRRQ
jgi:hypothetical protein